VVSCSEILHNLGLLSTARSPQGFTL
jgi:hypothetical protein